MKKLLLLGLMLLGLGGIISVKAGNVYGACSVANDCSWSNETHILSFTGVNGWQILYTGLPSGDITSYKKLHVTLSDMSDNISNIRLCIKDVNDNAAWANLVEGENNIDLAALAQANPDCDFTNIKKNDITLWSPSSSVSQVDGQHPASVVVEDLYMQRVKNVSLMTLKDEITDINYILNGGTFIIANTAGTAIQAYVNDADARETNLSAVTADMYYFFHIEALPALDIDGDGNDDQATYYRIAIQNAAGTAKPSNWWGDNYVNRIGWGALWSTTCAADKEDGYGRDGKFNAVWTIAYKAGDGFKFYNPKNNVYMTLNWTSSSETFVKLYKNLEMNVNSALDKDKNEANEEIFAFSKATGYDAEEGTITNGGWIFETPVDISDWDYLVITTIDNASNGSCKIAIADNDGISVAGNQYSGSDAGTGGDMYLDRWNHQNVIRISLDYLRATKGMDISKIKSLKFENNAGGDCVISISNVYLTDYNNEKMIGTYPNGDVVRQYTETGKYGTICLPYKASSYGAKIYSIAGKSSEGIILEQVSGLLEAGKPYFYVSSDQNGQNNEGNTRNVNFFRADWAEDVASPLPVEETNGLIGTFTDNTEVPYGKFILYNNQTYCVDSEFYVDANRAYIDKSKIENKQDAGSRTLLLPFFDAEDNDATAIEGTEAVEVLNEGVFYDMSGREVKNPTTGIYIVKYGNVTKKVMIK